MNSKDIAHFLLPLAYENKEFILEDDFLAFGYEKNIGQYLPQNSILQLINKNKFIKIPFKFSDIVTDAVLEETNKMCYAYAQPTFTINDYLEFSRGMLNPDYKDEYDPSIFIKKQVVKEGVKINISNPFLSITNKEVEWFAILTLKRWTTLKHLNDMIKTYNFSLNFLIQEKDCKMLLVLSIQCKDKNELYQKTVEFRSEAIEKGLNFYLEYEPLPFFYTFLPFNTFTQVFLPNRTKQIRKEQVYGIIEQIIGD